MSTNPDRPASADEVRRRLASLRADLREAHGVCSVAVFGSFARGEETATSDLDLLVEFDDPPGLLGFAGLQLFLEDRLGVPVDLFTRAMLPARLAPAVEADLVAV